MALRSLPGGMTELKDRPEGASCKEPHARIRRRNRNLRGNETDFALSLIGFRTGGGAAMGAEIFVEIPAGEHQKETFPGGSRRLALRAKQQRSPK